TCPLLQPAQEQQLLKGLREWKPKDSPKETTELKPKGKAVKGVPQDGADNSNTQFAILALWVARKYELPLESTFARIEERFRRSQLPSGGWAYRFQPSVDWPNGSMACVGLLGLAVGRGSATEVHAPGAAKERPRAEDDGIRRGLLALSVYMNDPTDT